MPLRFLNILILNVFINSGMGMIIPVLPSYLKHDGFSTAGLTLPFFVLILGRFLSKYYAGQLISYLGDKKILFICFLLYAGVFFIYPQLDSPWAFTLVRLFEGCVEGVGIICITDKAIAYSTQNRGKLMGYFGSSFGFGFILGPLLSGFMVSQYSIHAMFYSGALLGIIGAGMTLAFEADELKKKIASSHANMGKWKVYSPYLASYLPSLLRRALFFSFMLLIPLYTVDYLGLTPAQAGGFFSVSALMTTVFMPMTGRLSDRWSPKKITIISLIIMAITISLLGMLHHERVFTAVFILETVAFSFMLPAGTKLFADAVAAHPARQDIIGYYGSLTELVTLALALVLPSLYAFHQQCTWWLLGLLCLLSAGGLIWKRYS